MATKLILTMGILLMSLAAFGHTGSQAHHNKILPLVPRTAMIQNLIADQEQVWCVDSRAENYPGFVAQIEEVNNEYHTRVGIAHRQVAFGSSECEIKHTMPNSTFCNGCAANISYANWPVIVRYKWQLSYVLWQTTIGHELGHGLLGLHEQYIDLGSIQCDRSRTDTVMSCGTGVRYPQVRDADVACEAIDPNGEVFRGTLGCTPPVEFPWGPCTTWHCWNAEIGRWIAPDGAIFDHLDDNEWDIHPNKSRWQEVGP